MIHWSVVRVLVQTPRKECPGAGEQSLILKYDFMLCSPYLISANYLTCRISISPNTLYSAPCLRKSHNRKRLRSMEASAIRVLTVGIC